MKIISDNYSNKLYINQRSFKGGMAYENYAQIVRNGTLKEIQNIAWLHTCDRNGRSLLHEAIMQPRMEVIDYLSNIISPNRVDLNGITPFHIAVQNGNFDIVNLFLKKKANINFQDKNGNTPLHYALDDLQMIDFLLAKGAKTDLKNNFSLAPLHIVYRDLDKLYLLKQYGANINSKDSSGRTILHYAVEENNVDLVEKFIELGLDINAVDNYNQSSIFLTKDFEILSLLLSNGANPDIQDINGDTLLHKAARSKNMELYRFLVDNNANQYLINMKGNIPSDYIETKREQISNHGLGKVIGMDELKQTLRELVIEPLTQKQEFEEYGLSTANGVLLNGLPGCGKTFIAEALAEETGRKFYKIVPSDLQTQYYGIATQKIRKIFETARKNSPSIVFIDEMESIAPKRARESSSIAQDNNERIAELLQQMNNLGKDNVFVIGATNHPEMIDDAIKRVGRLDQSIFVPPPDMKARIGMFENQLRKRPVEKIIDLNFLAKKTENYTAKEIQGVVDIAAHIARKHHRKINMDDLKIGLNKIKPNITKAMISEYKKQVAFSDVSAQDKVVNENKLRGFAKVAGMDELKRILINDVIAPMSQTSLLRKYNIKPANGILLYGPPGTGKTFIAEALAEESDRYYISMQPSSVLSQYHNETALNIKKVFEEAEYNAPSIIFIDEIEALAPSRNSIIGSGVSDDISKQITELLQQLNNCSEKDIFVIAATNEPQMIDDAIRRVGRFDKTIFVPPPDFNARKEIFKLTLENSYVEKNINYEVLAKLTENYTAKEISDVIVRNAALNAYNNKRSITEKDLIKQIETFQPALTTKKIEEYKRKI